MAGKITITGDKDLQVFKQALAGFSQGRVNSILRAGLTASARVVVKHAKRPNYRFRDDTRRTRKSIRQFAPKQDAVQRRRGPVRHVSIGGPGARRGPLLAVGTKNKDGSRRIKARTPLRSAFEQTRSQQAQAAQQAMIAALLKIQQQILSRQRNRR